MGAMPCCEAQTLLPLWLDGELPGNEGLEIEQHLAACIDCSRSVKVDVSVRRALMRSTLGGCAPHGLRTRVDSSCRSERRVAQNRRTWRVVSAASLCVIAALLTMRRGISDLSLEHMMARHAGNLKMDVESEELKPVQQYLSGHLPFSVHFPSFHEKVVPQRLGARVIQLDNRDAAYIRYDTSRGRISLVVSPDMSQWPVEEEQVVRRVHGYSVTRWRDGGLVYSVVTDEPEVVRFAFPERF